MAIRDFAAEFAALQPGPPPPDPNDYALRMWQSAIANPSGGVPDFAGRPSPIVLGAQQISAANVANARAAGASAPAGKMDLSTTAAAYQRNKAASDAMGNYTPLDTPATIQPTDDTSWRNVKYDLMNMGMTRQEAESIFGGNTAPLGVGLIDAWNTTGLAAAGLDLAEAGLKGDVSGNEMLAMAAGGAVGRGKGAKVTRGGEKIVGAAVQIGGKIYVRPMHSEAAGAAVEDFGIDLPTLLRQHPEADVDGFMTNKGRYVSRTEAMQIAEQGNQLNRMGKAMRERGHTQLVAEGTKGMAPPPRAPTAAPPVVRHPTFRTAPRPADIAANSAVLPSVRGMSIPEAIRTATPQPHLIPGGESTRGAYVGGPADIQNFNDLRKLRERVFEYIAKEPGGGDWYDRYRAFLAEVTGANPLDAKTMSEMQALMSAGVDPRSELGFAMKQLNAAISGFGQTTKAARPAQQIAVNRSAAAQRAATTPEEMAAATKMATGKKTGAYADKINPYPPMSAEALTAPPGMGHNQGPPMFPIPERVPGSTGVNDFRYGRTWEYTEPTGEPLRGALGAAAHKFIDYETTLMVDAANRHNLGGRSNWTGEQLQAAPWVRQKAEDLMSRRPGLTYEQAIDEAMKTIADFAPGRTLSATHEARPGVGLGYLPQLDQATNAQVQSYSNDPRRSWATAPGGRDAIWAGAGIPNVGGATPTGRTGFNARVRPTIPMQGAYQPQDPTLPMEFNRGEVARPMVGIDTLPGGRKQLPVGDRALGTAAETLRALVDVQRFEAAHIPFVGGKVGESRAWVFKMPRALTEQEVQDLTRVAKKYGYTEVVDRGEGVTIEKFGSTAPLLQRKQMDAFLGEIKQVIPGAKPQRAYTDSVYADMADKFLAGEGSGQASQAFLDTLVTPELREAFDNNPYIAEAVLNKIDADWDLIRTRRGHNTQAFGRQDVDTMRRIVASGQGWVARLEQAVKDGTVPSVAAAGFFASMLAGGKSPGQAGGPSAPSEDKS